MQQILDRTQESLAQAFAALARNARRQQHLYYATIGLLIAIVVVSAILLVGLAAARELDNRRGHVAQYASAISLKLQSETSFLRRTTTTVRYYLQAASDLPPPEALVRQVRASGTGEAPDGRYTLLVPPETRAAWGDALPRRVWQLQQMATAALSTQEALELNHLAYVVDPGAAFAIILSPGGMRAGAATLRPSLVATLRDTLARAVAADGGGPGAPPAQRQQWVGPTPDPLLQAPAMLSVLVVREADRPVAFVAASVPANTFVSGLPRPSDPATLLLLNRAHQSIDVSPPAPPALVQQVTRHALEPASDTFRVTRKGVVLVQPMGTAFGALVYFLSYRTLFGALTQEVTLIGMIALVLVAAIVLAARYWDVNLLRRSHAEAARALENETINHILVSATPIGLCIVRRADNVVLTSNQVADALLGPAPRGTLPAHVVQALRHDTRPDTTDALASVAQVVVPARAPEAEAAGDVPPRFLQITHARARYQQQDVLFCAIEDVTARQQVEHELRAAQQASEAVMRARSNFFASMSHEIRTPLNALLGNLELLVRTPGMQAHAPRLKALNMASEALLRIVNDILDFSKIDAGEMKLANAPFRPFDELESLALAFAPLAANRPIRFNASLMPSLDTVLVGDRTRLTQIVNNLLSNAFKFTASGKISLGAEVATDAQGRKTLVCRVLDSGVGMPPELVARVFDPFVQGETEPASRYGGTGLGLSICARLCELMGGRIAVESVEGVGTAFTVEIPLEAAGAAVQLARTSPPPPSGGRALVLCQDAESGNALDAWLQAVGWRTNVVQTAAAARVYLRTNQVHVLMVMGDYDLATIASLRGVQPAGVVWLTRNGPDRPVRRAPGVHEVLAFSRSAIGAGLGAALHDPGVGDEDEGEPQEFTDEAASGNSGSPPAPPNEPASAPDAANTTHATDAPDAPAAGRTILVVEDNALNQALITEQLQTLGWHPVVVGDGRQALAMLDQLHPDVVLTDIHMPVMDGYALLEALQHTHPGLPVLALSAVTPTGPALDWESFGFAGHLDKPASLRELEQALRSVLDRATAQAAEPAPLPTVTAVPDLARYRALLREHLQTDLPELTRVIAARDPKALRHWAHRSAGAFLIVQAHDLVAKCRDIEHRCDAVAAWTPEMASLADALHTAVQHYAEGDTAPQP